MDGLDQLAGQTGFSGVVRIDREGTTEFEHAFGLANRAHGVLNRLDTQFGIASGTKGLTALAVASLVECGELTFATNARSVLGDDLPLIGDDVTIEHLLAHRSGIGDYLDENDDHDVDDYVMTVPVHQLATTEQYVAVLDGFPTVFTADERFAYNNGAFVVLALIAERVSGVPFADLVDERVFRPAGMHDTAFLRSDELPGRAAIGYLHADGLRTNVLHLPVRGSGDGGIYSTVADIHALWDAFFAGRIVGTAMVEELVRPRSDVPSNSMRYGLGFWLHPSTNAVVLEGCDAGVSFRSVHDPDRAVTHTVMSNTSDGAWPMARLLNETMGT